MPFVYIRRAILEILLNLFKQELVKAPTCARQFTWCRDIVALLGKCRYNKVIIT